jgi:hypothetical protein
MDRPPALNQILFKTTINRLFTKSVPSSPKLLLVDEQEL